ncbi:Conserved_hypothetical protein [Hexamita inflata]|uniref:Uncharacterized protein n=1 Tax=Hexamita inflata TaxID=28002 RepID=A0AA86V458_9EUKA|nr:Conserved hypothetical protein [Hexamita inflata]
MQLTPQQSATLNKEFDSRISEISVFQSVESQYQDTFVDFLKLKMDKDSRQLSNHLQKSQLCTSTSEGITFEELIANQLLLPTAMSCDGYFAIQNFDADEIHVEQLTQLTQYFTDSIMLSHEECLSDGLLTELEKDFRIVLINNDFNEYKINDPQIVDFLTQKSIVTSLGAAVSAVTRRILDKFLDTTAQYRSQFFPKQFALNTDYLQSKNIRPQFTDYLYPINRYSMIENVLKPDLAGKIQLKRVCDQIIQTMDEADKYSYYISPEHENLLCKSKDKYIQYPQQKLLQLKIVHARQLMSIGITFLKMSFVKEAEQFMKQAQYLIGKQDAVLLYMTQLYSFFITKLLNEQTNAQTQVTTMMQLAKQTRILTCAGLGNIAADILIYLLNELDGMRQISEFTAVSRIFYQTVQMLPMQFMRSRQLIKFSTLFEKHLKLSKMMLLWGFKQAFSLSVFNPKLFCPHDTQVFELMVIQICNNLYTPLDFCKWLVRDFSSVAYFQLQNAYLLNQFVHKQVQKRGFHLAQLNPLTQPDIKGQSQKTALSKNGLFVPVQMHDEHQIEFTNTKVTLTMNQNILNEYQNVKAEFTAFNCKLQSQIQDRLSNKLNNFEFQLINEKNKRFQKIFVHEPVVLQLALPLTLQAHLFEVRNLYFNKNLQAQIISQYCEPARNSLIVTVQFIQIDNIICELFELSHVEIGSKTFSFRAQVNKFEFILYNKFCYLKLMNVQTINSNQFEETYGYEAPNSVQKNYLQFEFKTQFTNSTSFTINTRENQYVFIKGQREFTRRKLQLKQKDYFESAYTLLEFEIPVTENTLMLVVPTDLTDAELTYVMLDQVFKVQLQNYQKHIQKTSCEQYRTLTNGSFMVVHSQTVGTQNQKLVLKKLGYSTEHLVFVQNNEQIELNFGNNFAQKQFYNDVFADFGVNVNNVGQNRIVIRPDEVMKSTLSSARCECVIKCENCFLQGTVNKILEQDFALELMCIGKYRIILTLTFESVDLCKVITIEG